ncbi:hypothetical protein [Paracoccus aerodenitrificans]|uniref:hypothetical protein n=1 Tax=Paracoccus aerodenitrificans TaxID=3017781 RepID=UPI0022EFF1EB|nr:hypothetical protein [Paracoccus aerodenitrificans]WBU63441.1 hypothetical protein PAE61_13910 [Paracoccus aerodenitrificans]
MAALLTLSPAEAAQFVPPDGCQLEMTVQNRGCRVSQHYVCAQDNPGDQHVVYFDPEGPVHYSKIDAETRWLESTNLITGLSDYLVPDAQDHASFSTLLATGRDDFDFWTESSTGERLRNVGEDRLTGERVTIDGVELELTEYELRMFSADGQLLIESKGQQFINRDHGRFYGGVEIWSDWTGETREEDDSPASFAFEGEAGFGSTEPLFDCQMQMVRSGEKSLIYPAALR